MPLQFTIAATIPASREKIYQAWLSTEGHSAMTGAPATANSSVGGTFTAYSNYISGKNLELIPFTKIVQSWRTTEFSAAEEDSLLEILLEEKGNDTLLTLTHSNLPPHGTTYKQGWEDYYFKPLQQYFSSLK